MDHRFRVEASLSNLQPRMATPLAEGSPVRVTGGTHKGRVGTVTKLTKAQVYVDSPDCVPREVRINKSSVTMTELEDLLGDLNVGPRTPASCTPASRSARRPPRAPADPARPPPPSFQLPGSDAATATMGGTPIAKVIMQRTDVKPEESFLSEWAGGRALTMEFPLPLGQDTVIEPKVDQFGCQYELLAAKVVDNGKSLHGKSYVYRLTYAATKGEGVPAINLCEELEKHGDFSTCSTVRKAAARLQMYVSTAKRALELRSSDFEVVPEPMGEVVPEPMGDGCAFIPDAMLWDAGGGVGALAALRAIIDRDGLPVKKNVTQERTVRVIAEEIDAERARSGGHRPSALSEALQLLGLQLRVMGPQLGVVKGVLSTFAGFETVACFGGPMHRKLTEPLLRSWQCASPTSPRSKSRRP